MGILNVTPDSFAAPRTLLNPAAFVDHALQMEADGADVIDIGGESTRPGALPVALDDELARVLPVVKGLAGRLRIPISVDTYKAGVARAALDAGAAIVNDISGLRYEPALADVAAEYGAGLVLMHTRGRPASMYAEAVYDDVIGEVVQELRASIACADCGRRRARERHCRPRRWVCQTAESQLWCAGAHWGACRRARSPGACRPFAQVVHARCDGCAAAIRT